MKTTEQPKISFIDGFKWAMPVGFADALLKCKFEDGDTLYDTKEAYENTWGEAQGKIKEYIQIKYPPRSSTATKAAEDKQVFESNWVGQVVYDRYDQSIDKIESVTTTQGRLLRLLLYGEKIDNESDPTEPLMLRDLHNEIQTFFNSKAEKTTADANSDTDLDSGDPTPKSEIKIQPYLASEYTEPFAFIMPHNKIGPTSGQKERAIVKSFDKSLRYNNIEVSLDKAGIQNHEKYLPYVVITCFLIKNTDQESIKAAIKSALYTPVKNKITDRENYNLNKHGVLLPLRG